MLLVEVGVEQPGPLAQRVRVPIHAAEQVLQQLAPDPSLGFGHAAAEQQQQRRHHRRALHDALVALGEPVVCGGPVRSAHDDGTELVRAGSHR